MKVYPIFILFICIVASSITGFGQIDPSKLIKKKVEKKAKKELEKTIDKGLEGNKQNSQDNEAKRDETLKNNTADSVQTTNDQSQNKLKVWSKYDFVSGDKIIFEDDLNGEESGEFPSRWDLISGTAQNASLQEINVIQFVHKNTLVTPLMKKKNFLPDAFTIEFDVFFEELATRRTEQYQIRFFEGRGVTERGNRDNRVIDVFWDKVKMGSFGGETADYKEEKKSWKPKWKHIAIAFNKRSLKLYMDHERMLNMPNVKFKPTMFSIGGQYDERFIKICAIKDIRVNEGGKGLYDRVMADGKFVTHGILFDVNKSTIRAESMGTINEIVKLMNDHPDLKFRIEGHTDSDGEDGYNQKLSEERAVSVKSLFVDSGIDASRFETKGYGESKPIDDNTTPEGKANNRRVEFIKL
jgi:OOP family OmpA-OmpF porin